MSVYIDNFFMISNIIETLKTIKVLLSSKYNIKNLSNIKIIIKQQINKNSVIQTIKIDKSVFI